MTYSFKSHQKEGNIDKQLQTKRAKLPPGEKLHTWTMMKLDKGIAYYRCLICDFYDNAKWPHTPEPREPYCK